MRSLFIGCRQLVCKLWLGCVRLTHLYPWPASTRSGMLVSRGLYTQLTSYFTTYFSTLISLNSSLFLSYFYPVSTPPTNAMTNFITFIKPLAAVGERAV
jgi:hypothetical protein